MDNSKPKYKAIETIHSGYRFRSRLEARWAVFFEALGIEYRYEPEGFELEDIRYLPDFYLPKLETWIEIKPDTPTQEEREKAIQLCLATKQAVVLLAGDVWHDVKAHTFSSIPPGMLPRDVEETLEGITSVWLSTTECVFVDESTDFFGYNFHREFCWSFSKWAECTKCNSVFLLGFGTYSCPCYSRDTTSCSDTSSALRVAFAAARQARF